MEEALEAKHLAGMNWMQVEDYLKSDDRLMLVLGSCEQHAYLSLLSDVQVPEAIAAEVSKRTGVLVAPSMPYGFSSFFAAFPGTLSIRMPTLVSVVREVIEAAHQQGFRRILIVNGHGGNSPVWTVLGELVSELPGLKVDLQSWWQCPPIEAILKRHNLGAHHASGIEAFPFNRVAPLPEGSKPEVPERGFLTPELLRQHAGDGMFGGAYVLEEGIYAELIEAAVADAIDRFERMQALTG